VRKNLYKKKLNHQRGRKIWGGPNLAAHKMVRGQKKSFTLRNNDYGRGDVDQRIKGMGRKVFQAAYSGVVKISSSRKGGKNKKREKAEIRRRKGRGERACLRVQTTTNSGRKSQTHLSKWTEGKGREAVGKGRKILLSRD